MNSQENLSNPKPGNISFLKNEVKEAIILAGGLGTRLRSAVPDLPKCIAPVAGNPFLYYVINYLRMQGIEKIIFSLGYMNEVILQWLQKDFPTLNHDYVIETEPLGTGGAIQFALQKVTAENVFIANGDTLFKFDASCQFQIQQHNGSECTLALKPMHDFDRYGVVEVDGENYISSFKEKQFYKDGLINAGLYLLNKNRFLARKFPAKFSFEKDYLEKLVGEKKFSGAICETYFIDIGIPEDFNRAQLEFQKKPLDFSDIDNSWTLFLDRDGVINHDKPGGYITTEDEFQFTPGSPGLFQKLSKIFKRIIVITNQRGVGRGIIQPGQLEAMNKKLLEGVEKAGGKIDRIYFCTDIDDRSFNRKPNPGMALRAASDFPDIDFEKAIIVGNSLSDMKFGRYAGIYTVFVTTTNKTVKLPHADIDLIFDDLDHFAKSLK